MIKLGGLYWCSALKSYVVPFKEAEIGRLKARFFCRSDNVLVSPSDLVLYRGDRLKLALENLGPRQIEVLRLLLQAKKSSEIGEAMFLTTRGVKFHLTNIYKSFGVKGKNELIVRLNMRGLNDHERLKQTTT